MPAASAAFLILSGCSQPAQPNEERAAAANAADGTVAPSNQADAGPPPVPSRARPPAVDARVPPPVEPPAPGTPGGLPDDRTPVSEAPFTPESAQGAANVVQTYYAHLESGDYGAAWALWSDGGRASGMDRGAFAASFAKYAEYHAQIGAPSQIEGAAGSLYVTVPVVVYGRLKTGEDVHMNGPVTLRRVNGVPGSTAAQRQWHIRTIGVRPRPRAGG